jgi:hypothetical protein
MTQSLSKSLALGLLLLISGAAVSAENLPNWAGQSVLSATTAKGLKIEMDSEFKPLEINKIHSWLIRLNDSQGDPISNAAIEFTGGMPLHNHGLPTQPQVTTEIAPGIYLLEGLRFHMQGAWRLDLQLNWDSAGSQASDSAIIDFNL